jgi:hypothetical protein
MQVEPLAPRGLPRLMGATRLENRDLTWSKEAVPRPGGLTVLVGPQRSGRSLALQWLKPAPDGKHLG